MSTPNQVSNQVPDALPGQLPVVGFVGLGAMGMGMALSLLQAGYSVQGYDINDAARARFAQAGGQAVDTLPAVARGAEIVVLMVLNAEQIDQILFGDDKMAGMVGALAPASLVIVSSTVKPTYVETLAARLAAHQIDLLDAPVSGGTSGANDGTLSIMVAGAPASIQRADPLLQAMGKNIYIMGERPGMGSTMKMVNQVLAGVQIAAAAEALALGARAGLDPNRVYEVICNSAGASWMFENRVPHILADDYRPHSAVEIWLKDLGLVVDTGKELHLPTPLAAAAQQLFIMAAAAGHTRLDDAAVIKVYEQLAGFRVLDSVAAPESD
ncbi:MAG: L-threonate dehydrogenase [Litorilinea sp.]